VSSAATLHLEQPMALNGAGVGATKLTVTAFAVPGKVPLWLEEAWARTRIHEDGRTIVWRLPSQRREHGFSSFLLRRNDASLSQRLSGAALVFFDGTLWRE